MKTRHPVMIGAAVAALALTLSAFADDNQPRRPRLRKQVMLLRAELAELATQVSFVTKGVGVQPGDAMPGFPAGSLCADPCATDSDGDGLGDCEDYCPCDPNTADDDADAIPDCADPCPGDAVQDCINPCKVDSDKDGTNDCEDPCPWDPAGSVDSDHDNIPDCQDYCPNDSENLCFEPCKIDRDGDGIGDCDDACPWVSGADGTIGECVPPPVSMN